MSPIFVPVEPDIEEPPVEPPVIHPEYHHGFTLVGGDGSRWDLVTGPVYILAGASGFGFPDPDHRWNAGAGTDGATHQGMRYPERDDIALPLEVDGRQLSPEDWRDLEQRIWRALNPRRECQLIVSSPAGETRTLTFRYSGGGDPDLELDALLRADNVYPLEGVAGDPFWYGEQISRDYTIAPSPPTFPGPPFYLGSSTAIQNTTVTNPGDEDAWARWVITGPYNDVTVGVDAAVVTLDTPVGAGEVRIIDTRPGRRYIRDEAQALKWSEATEKRFAPIPAGADSNIVMSLSGGIEGQSSIGLTFNPPFLRAFS